MNGITLTMALLMGFTGSLHCAGMCGPIIWVMPFNFMHGVKKWAGILLYHFGRISVYALLALVLYSFRSLFDPRLQQYVSISLGILLLLTGIFSFLPGTALKVNLPWSVFIKKHLGRFIGNPSLGTLFISGALNGLLPCGLVYMALSAAVMAHTTVDAALAMYAFGLGTMPMLISITILKSKAAIFRSNHFKKMVPVLVFAFGCLFILRGLNLGIPYLSPGLEITSTEVKASCCHKK